MDTRSLRAFAALASSLHFGRAASQCNLSPSALSRLIQRLEHELGCRLFDRSNREVSLTPEGRLLQARSGDLLDRIDEIRRGIGGRQAALSGSISLYCSVTASYSVLAELLPAYRRQNPMVEVKIHTGDESIAVRRVQQGLEDLAIAARPDRLPAGLRFAELATTPLVFIAPVGPEQPVDLMGGGAAARRALSQTPLVVPESGLARERIDRWLAQRAVEPQIYAQVAGNEAIAGMVALGLGCGIVPLLVLRESPFRDRVQVLDVRPALPPFRVGLCCRARSLRNPLVASLWQHASQS